MPRFTDMFLKSLKPRDAKYQVRETVGFALRVSPAGRKTFLFIYETGGKRKELNLGVYPAISIAEARSKYHESHDKWMRGEDPSPPKKPSFATDLLPELTLKQLKDRYISWSESAGQSKDHVRNKKADLENHLLPLLGDMTITAITRKDILMAFLTMQECGIRPGAKRNVHRATNAMFDYAVAHSLIEISPCYLIRKAITGMKSVERTVVLTQAGIKKAWAAIDSAGATQVTKNALKLVLVTAQRPGEAVGIEWHEVDGDWWTIPPEKAAKGKRHHRVFLTPLAKELMGPRSSGFVFPSPKLTRNSHLSRTALRKISEQIDMDPKWTPHDLRRTARTHMSRLGIPREHAEAVLNHSKQGMVKVYDQYEYDKEKKLALMKWERELKKLIL